MKAPLTPSNVSKIVAEIQQRHRESGNPVSLNELPLWKPLTKSQKIKTGRGFKKMVEAGEVEAIKFTGVRKDNHSTYKPTGVSSSQSHSKGIIGFIRKLFS